jgi:ribosomal protein L31E
MRSLSVPLRGRAKALGSRLTLERFMEMQREDIDLENEIDDRLWKRGNCPANS